MSKGEKLYKIDTSVFKNDPTGFEIKYIDVSEISPTEQTK